MAKDDKLLIQGTVSDILPNTTFKVSLLDDSGDPTAHEVIAYLAGKLRQNNIKIIQGDIVDIEMTPYDLTKGRIIYRHK
jgi:translation initiation factor IF-1|tara:strand:- start:633 stop:869 length:237 start_codon:yes stop_codon:yes gene_type:complete